MTIDEFLSRLHGVKKSGRGWAALCPSHTDTRTSLSVGLNGGKILVSCKANQGCTAASITAAMGVKVSDLFTDSRPPLPRASPRARLVKAYDYTDAQGKVLYQACRFDPKDFRQRRPDGKGWAWNLDGVRGRTLYRLRDLTRRGKAGQGEAR